MEIVEYRMPSRDERLRIEVAPQRMQHRPTECPYLLDRCKVAARRAALAARRAGQHRRQRPEFGDQPLRGETGVARCALADDLPEDTLAARPRRLRHCQTPNASSSTIGKLTNSSISW